MSKNMNKLEAKRDKLFAKIVQDIRGMYNHELSDTEAHEAARNLIEFVKILLEHAEK